MNLIGEYTDFNLGFVLPVAIDREVWIAREPRDCPVVELSSVELNETRSFAFEGLTPTASRTGSWIDYVAGGAPATSDSCTLFQSTPTVLSTTAHPCTVALPLGSRGKTMR